MGMLIRLRRIYNFLLFHANILQLLHTFGNFLYYFGTNILIQCPVPVPVCCMFFVLQKYPYETESKRDKNLWRFFWNICDFWEEESTRDDTRGGQEAGGVPQGVRRALGPRGHPVRGLVPFFHHKKASIRIKIVCKI